MRIIQLTDLHLGREGEDSHGVDVRQNFLNLLEKIPDYHADEIMITGDLCLHEGDAEVYKWIYEQIKPLGLPIRVISGNHDESTLLAKAFGMNRFLKGKELFYLRTETPVPIFHLDTAKGSVSDQQLTWLETEIQKCIDPIIIFMHHPPLLAGVPYMDRKHALKNREDLQAILLTHSDLIHIYCGHYHVEKLLSYYNIMVHITPSTYFQMSQDQEDFAVDHYQVGFRVIDLSEDQISSTIVYADGVSLVG